MINAGIAAPSGKYDATSPADIMADPCTEFSVAEYVELKNESVHAVRERAP
jgi:hypothetical protein